MSPPRILLCRRPHSPKHPGTDAGEDPHHQKPHEITVEHAHKALLPPRDEAEHDAPIAHRLIGAYRYDTCMHLCPYAPRRRCRGVGRGQPLTDPSPGTIPRICSPVPALVASCPPPFKFTQEPLFFFLRTRKTKSVLTNALIKNRHCGIVFCILVQSIKAVPKSIRLNCNVIQLCKFQNQNIILNDLYEEVSNALTLEDFYAPTAQEQVDAATTAKGWYILKQYIIHEIFILNRYYVKIIIGYFIIILYLSA